MFAVWKFPLGPAMGPSGEPLHLPVGATVIHAGQDPEGAVCVWAIVNTNAPLERRAVKIVDTGQMIDPKWQHLLTRNIGPYVEHAFLAPGSGG